MRHLQRFLDRRDDADFAANTVEPRRDAVLDAAGCEKLHADADAKKRAAPAVDRFENRLDHPWNRIEVAAAVGKRTVARQDDAVGAGDHIGFGGDDDFVVSMPDVEKIRAANPDVTLHVYPGGKHAFFNPEQVHHDAAIAAKAWANSLAFLDRNLRANG